VSFTGFEKAVAKLPMPVLRALAAAIRVAFHQCGRSEAIVLGNGGHLLPLEVGKRGIFQNLQADAEEGGADESNDPLGASRDAGG
jgi:hypothetical protein